MANAYDAQTLKDSIGFIGQKVLPQSVDNVHDTVPTLAQITTALGPPKRGKIGTIDDADGETNIYLCIATDNSWAFLKFTKAS